MTTTLQAWGNSQGVRLPKSLLASLDLKSGDAVEIELTPKKDAIIMRPREDVVARPRSTSHRISRCGHSKGLQNRRIGVVHQRARGLVMTAWIPKEGARAHKKGAWPSRPWRRWTSFLDQHRMGRLQAGRLFPPLCRCEAQILLPMKVWMPHSLLSKPVQRPARSFSPSPVGRVQGWQPMER